MLQGRAIRRGVLALLLAAASPSLAGAQTTPAKPTPTHRVILNDGTALVSYGEAMRVGDRVLFSMPIGGPGSEHLQLVSLPIAVVDWETTLRYLEAARYARYVATSAEEDYAQLTGQIAETLNQIALAKEPARKLELAEGARRVLRRWPIEHMGYKSSEVRDLDSLLEGVVSDLRESTGVQSFDFSLVATVDPPSMPLLPEPSLSQAIEQTIATARVSDVPAERLALLQSAISLIDQNRSTLPRAWARRTRAAAKRAFDAELKVERGYDDLTRTAERRATAAEAAADVRAIEQQIAAVRDRDRRFGEQRKEQVSGLLAVLQERLDSARRLRLVRDQWARKAETFRAYRRAIAAPLSDLDHLRSKLQEVKSLAGPDVVRLSGLIHACELGYRQLKVVTAPEEMAAAHATLLSATELAQQAFRTRERATMSASLPDAWEASSAAAGALMMLAQGKQQIETIAQPPDLRR